MVCEPIPFTSGVHQQPVVSKRGWVLLVGWEWVVWEGGFRDMWDRSGWNLVFWRNVWSRGGVIVGLSLVVNLCHEAVVVVGVVGHMLYPAIWQCHCVGAFDIACNIS